MALGRREGSYGEMWIATNRLARSPGHPFYERLNRVLGAAGFDRFVEERCKPFYAAGHGRPSIPPGVYFRMLMVGYFEGIDSQRGIAWRCTDSLALREFLGVGLGDRVPDHSSLTVIRQRLALDLHEEVFVFVLKVLAQKGVLRGKTIGVDATTLEANAAMKSIVRRDTGESWREYIRRLAAEEGVEDPTDDDARRMDRGRPKKRVSNQDWASAADPESRITKLKDGRTRLGYKAEHVVDLQTEAVLAATIYPGDASDGETFVDSLSRSQENVARAESEAFAEEVVTDKGLPHGEHTGRGAGLRNSHVHPGAQRTDEAALAGQAARMARGIFQQPPPRASGQGTTAATASGGATGTKLRPRVRHRSGAAHLAARNRERAEALRRHARGEESWVADARAVRDRVAEELAGTRIARICPHRCRSGRVSAPS